jgi:putative radical SAM enzyme (TIGR03279 family)
MSPIYVSVHATDPDLRTRMLRNKNAGKAMDQLRRLAKSRITMHTQIVLCPGFNDGEQLERTVRDLASLHPWVASIAIVPVGLTRHREGLTPLVKVNADLAARVIESCEQWQREFKRDLGTRLVFPSDEFYLLSGKPFPSTAAYEGFPQLEDGIGVSRLFLDDLRRADRQVAKKTLRPGRYLLVTGTLAAPLLEQLAETLSRFEGVEASVCPVVNKFLGDTVTVAGLLTGQDIASALAEVDSDVTALIPDVMLNEGRFLDDMTIPVLEDVVRCRIMVVPSAATGVLRALSVRVKPPRRPVSRAASAGTLSREQTKCQIR